MKKERKFYIFAKSTITDSLVFTENTDFDFPVFSM